VKKLLPNKDQTIFPSFDDKFSQYYSTSKIITLGSILNMSSKI